MKNLNYVSESPQQTIMFGFRLAKHLKGGDIVCLFGNLGTGKTTLTKGVAQGLKIPLRKVNSPSYVLMNEYKGRYPLFHFDFYRIEKAEEIHSIGYEEFFYDNGITVVEWPERMEGLLPGSYLHVQLTTKGRDKRLIKLRAHGGRYEQILQKVSV